MSTQTSLGTTELQGLRSVNATNRPSFTSSMWNRRLRRP
jgi:hypothetical protein